MDNKANNSASIDDASAEAQDEAYSPSVASENDEDDAARLSARSRNAPVDDVSSGVASLDAATIAHEPQPPDSSRAQLEDVVLSVPPPFRYITAVHEEGDVHKQMESAPTDQISTKEAVEEEDQQETSSETLRQVELCPEDEAPVPQPYLEGDFCDMGERKKSEQPEICPGGEPPVPPQYLEESVEDNDPLAKKKKSVAVNVERPPIGSPGATPFSANEMDAAIASEVLGGANIELPEVRDVQPSIPDQAAEQPPMPPQYLEESVEDNNPIAKKNKSVAVNVERPPIRSPGATPFSANEERDVQLSVTPEIDAAIASEVLGGANTELPEVRDVQSSIPDQAAEQPQSRLIPDQLQGQTPPHLDTLTVRRSNPLPAPFYEVEARLVTESERDDRPRYSETVYDAILVRANSHDSQPWWKRHRGSIVVGILALMVGSSLAIGLLVPQPPPPQPPPSVPPYQLPLPHPPPVHGIMNVTHLGNLFETDCDGRCWPSVQVNGDTAALAPLRINPHSGKPLNAPEWLPQIHIFNKTADGTFKAVQQLDVDFQPGSIAIFDDVMVVGSNWETLETGAVYIYERNNLGLWNQMQRIVPADSRIDAEFGFHVDIYMDVMVIGAYQDREGKIGSVYIYRRNDHKKWSLERKLAPPDDEKIENFGMAVTIKGNRIAVGDRAYGGNKTATGPKKGAVWVYSYDASLKNWTELTGVMTNDDCDYWFGVSLAFTYDYGLLIGCPGEDSNTGAVYYYEPSDTGYVFRQKIVASDGGRSDMIGDKDQISVRGNVMAVGTNKKSDGAVYIFLRKNNAWVEAWKIESPSEDSRKFGDRVALWGNHLLVSSWYNAYFYELVKGPSMFGCMSLKADGAMFDADCKLCNPFVAIDGGSAVIAKYKESLQILSGNNNSLENMTFGVDHKFGGVAISGDVVVAGAPDVKDKSGSVSIFQKTSGSWLESAQISPHPAGYREKFGGAVDIDGDSVIVGAYDYMVNEGSAYIFRRNESSPSSRWIQEAKLLPDDSNLHGFGRPVGIINGTAAIGDLIYKGTTGAVFVYVYEPSSNTWTQLNETITNNDCDGEFGSSLALTRDKGILIGCPREQNGAGAVYYYTQSANGNGYILQQKIKSVGGVSNDKFGGPDQIAVDGNIMVVGTDKETNGTVHVFAKMNGAWIEVVTVESPPGSRRFGYRVALSGRKVLISSIYNVHSYTLDEC